MGVFSFNKEKDFKKAFAQESQRQKDFTKKPNLSDESMTLIIDEENYRYKLLMKVLKKFDNEKADAVRMAFYFLENEHADINEIEKFLQ